MSKPYRLPQKDLTRRQQQQLEHTRTRRAGERGLIGIVAQDQSRYSRFWQSFAALTARHPSVDITFNIGAQLAKQRNDVFAKAQDEKYDWVWFIDDDHIFPPDTLEKLLAHNVDIVGPLYCIRSYPFDPTARRLSPNNDMRLVFNVPASGPPGLHEVESTGTSGLLVRRPVLEVMQRPWFTVGHLHPEMIAEDFFFCSEARKAGFKVHLATDVTLEHISQMGVSQQYLDGAWYIVIDMGHNKRLTLKYNVKEEGDAT